MFMNEKQETKATRKEPNRICNKNAAFNGDDEDAGKDNRHAKIGMSKMMSTSRCLY